MSADDETAGLRARVDGAIGDLDDAIVDLAGRLERHELDDVDRLERVRECVAALKLEVVDVVARVTELERRLGEVSP